VAKLPPVATLPAALTVPPWDGLPPVDAPPVVSDEQPHTSVALAKAATSAGNRDITVHGLPSGCRFGMEVLM
jgi:hypothetical protein